MISPVSERDHFLAVLEKYSHGTATKQEIDFVEHYYDYIQKHGATDLNWSEIDKERTGLELKTSLLKAISNNDINDQDWEINTSLEKGAKTISFKWKWPAIAAAALFIVGTLIYQFAGNEKVQPSSTNTLSKAELPLNADKALLTLDNGSTITLDSASIGIIAQQGNTRITKLNNGQLIYEENTTQTENQAQQHNIVSTPKGGQFHIVLPDGSKAWMNAASSIRFPVAFGKDRKVTISGEVYFEIAKLKDKAFIVEANGTEVQVLGTSFNMKAYRDDAFIETTLLEGSIKVLNASSTLLLKPGQQAVYNDHKAIQLVQNIALDKVIAWKNGLFCFEDADVQTFMKQLERWYAIEVKYDAEIPRLQFTGKMERNLNLSQLLKVLKTMGLNCKVEKNVLTVYP